MQNEINLEWTHLREVLERYGETAKELYKRNLTESGRPTTQNSLINSLHTEVVVGETSIAVDLSLLPYYKYIEHGTRPHWAPIAPLKEWVSVKPLLPRPLANGKLPTPTQMAYMAHSEYRIANYRDTRNSQRRTIRFSSYNRYGNSLEGKYELTVYPDGRFRLLILDRYNSVRREYEGRMDLGYDHPGPHYSRR